DPTTTPATSLRNAVHPDHLEDVRSALFLLQRTYGFGSNYVLLGHSAGATLAFQLVMQQQPSTSSSTATSTAASAEKASLPLPRAIVGVAGIYDIPALVFHHDSVPVYREFVTSAFGPDEKVWGEASPAKAAAGVFGEWKEVEAVVLAWSSEDSLVEEEQVRGMEMRLRGELGDRVVWRRGVRGEHDEVWEDGSQMVGLIEFVAERLGRGD
ncbi:hypothetical protein LTS18_014564, partial [Coniosporium uncinatum]